MPEGEIPLVIRSKKAEGGTKENSEEGQSMGKKAWKPS